MYLQKGQWFANSDGQSYVKVAWGQTMLWNLSKTHEETNIKGKTCMWMWKCLSFPTNNLKCNSPPLKPKKIAYKILLNQKQFDVHITLTN